MRASADKQLANTRSFYDLLLRCCLSKVGWFRETRRFAPTLLILRRAVLSAFYPVFKEPGLAATPGPSSPAFPTRFGALTAAPVVVRGTLQSYDGNAVSVNPRPGFRGSALANFPTSADDKAQRSFSPVFRDRLSGIGLACAAPFSAPDHRYYAYDPAVSTDPGDFRRSPPDSRTAMRPPGEAAMTRIRSM